MQYKTFPLSFYPFLTACFVDLCYVNVSKFDWTRFSSETYVHQAFLSFPFLFIPFSVKFIFHLQVCSHDLPGFWFCTCSAWCFQLLNLKGKQFVSIENISILFNSLFTIQSILHAYIMVVFYYFLLTLSHLWQIKFYETRSIWLALLIVLKFLL